MIVKKSLKTAMPIMKRCRVGDSGGDDDELSVNRKKRKTSNDYFPLHLLGEAAAGIIPFNGYGVQKIAAEAPVGGGGAASESRSEQPSKSKEVSRPPLVRTSRGRVQVLPSRFNDSILDNWKKESKNAVREDTEYVPVKQKDNKSSSKPLRIRDDVNVPRKQSEWRKFSPLSVDEIAELRNEDGYDDDDDDDYDECIDISSIDRLYSTKDFGEGDIVWAIPGKHCPAWPAIVLNHELQVPTQVFNYRIAGAVCVMFFGYSGNGTQRNMVDGIACTYFGTPFFEQDYAWIKSGRIFPFVDYVDRFQGQTELNDNKPGNLRSAIEEAFLAENGFNEMLMVEISAAAGKSHYPHSLRRRVFEATGLNQDQQCSSAEPDAHLKKESECCEACGTSIAPYLSKKVFPGTNRLCTSCTRLKKMKHYCGICKKIRNQSDNGTWDLAASDYYCPECKARFNFELSDSETLQSKNKKKNGKFALPDKVAVVCCGVEGIYYPSLHLVVCKCGCCGMEKQALSEWERHTGSKTKNWKSSVRVKGSLLPLEQWMAECHERSLVPAKSVKRPSIKLRKQKLLNFLQEHYEPVCAKWTTERCAVCRWVEDWDFNKTIICIRCQIAVHQECYGARHVSDFTSWVCRACETPDIERECCLCPVKGVDLLTCFPLFRNKIFAKQLIFCPLPWKYGACPWNIENSFKLFCEGNVSTTHEPNYSWASFKFSQDLCGLQTNPRFMYAMLQVFHLLPCNVRVKSRLHCLEKNGKQFTKMVSYCAYHRAPNPDTVLIVETPKGIFSTKNLLQNKRHMGARLISTSRLKLEEPSPEDTKEVDPFSAARCRVYIRTKKKMEKPRDFSTFRERLHHLQKTEKDKVCFGQSAIHGWGLFARRNILEGEMVVEYRGEQVRRSVADLREARSSTGKRLLCYADTAIVSSEGTLTCFLFAEDLTNHSIN
ncbi:hypothetical protein SASPL_128074 [Salvia splendens]|uniref:PHD-type domain-containing protein n=1 Tax=Salvia splendens TaxID=180675 RepID=A0A8X8ZLR6_SALSN|nr:hypothetical protein SASPL_128074 [Salvia splendens]